MSKERLLNCPYCEKTGIRPCNYLRHVWPCKRKKERQVKQQTEPWKAGSIAGSLGHRGVI